MRNYYPARAPGFGIGITITVKNEAQDCTVQSLECLERNIGRRLKRSLRSYGLDLDKKRRNALISASLHFRKIPDI